MSTTRAWLWWAVALAAGCSGTSRGSSEESDPLRSDPPKKEAAPTHSSPIALTSDDRYVWSVNPDNDSVSVFEVANEGGAPSPAPGQIDEVTAIHTTPTAPLFGTRAQW